jgi:hypothetical protein
MLKSSKKHTEKYHPVYHYGIDRFVGHILRSIAATQFVLHCKIAIYITNDFPDDPHERSLGLTVDQIAELILWLSANRSRLPNGLQVFVLQIEDLPRHGMLWKIKDLTKIMTKI